MAGEGGVYISIGGGVSQYLIKSLAELKKALDQIGKTKTPKVDVNVGQAVDNIDKLENEVDGLFESIVEDLKKYGESTEYSLDQVVKSVLKTTEEVSRAMDNVDMPETTGGLGDDDKKQRLEIYNKLLENLEGQLGKSADAYKEANRRANEYTEQLVKFYRVLQEIQESEGIDFDLLKEFQTLEAFTDNIAKSEEKVKKLMELDLEGYLKRSKDGYVIATEAAREFLGVTVEELKQLEKVTASIEDEYKKLSELTPEEMAGFDSESIIEYERNVSELTKRINKYKETLKLAGFNVDEWISKLGKQKQEAAEVKKQVRITDSEINRLAETISDISEADLEMEDAEDGLKSFEKRLNTTFNEVERKSTALGKKDLLEPFRDILDQTKDKLEEFKNSKAFFELSDKIAQLREDSKDLSLLDEEAISRSKSRVSRLISQLDRLRDQGKISGDVFEDYESQLLDVRRALSSQADVLKKQKSEWSTYQKQQAKAAEVAEHLKNEIGRLNEESSDFEVLGREGFNSAKSRINSLRSYLNKYVDDFHRFGTVSEDEIDGFKRNIEVLGDSLESTRTDFKKTMESLDTDEQREAFRQLGEEWGTSTQKLKRYKRAIQDVSDIYDSREVQLRREIEQLEAVTKRSAKQEKKLHELRDAYDKLGDEQKFAADAMERYEESVLGIDKKHGKLSQGLRETTTHLGFLGHTLHSVGKRVKQFGAFVVAAFAVGAIVQGIQELIQVVSDYDQALHNLQAILDITASKSQVLGDRIQRVAEQTKFSATETAEGVQTLGQAGLTVNESIQALDGVTTLATGTLSNFQTVADLVTSTLNAFQLQATDSSRIADNFANAINNSKLTVDKLVTSFNYVGAAGKQAGLTLNELTGVMMTLADNGMRASTIGTGLRRMLLKMLNPTEDVRREMEAAGIAIDDLNPKVVGVQSAFENLIPMLWDAQNQTVDMQKAVSMFGTRAAQVAAIIVRSVADGSGAISKAVQQTKELGAASEMASIQQEGLALKIKNLQDRVKNVGLALGDTGLTGIIKDVVDALRMASVAVFDFIKGNEFKVEVAGWTTAVTTLVFGVSGLITIMRKMIAAQFFAKLAARMNLAKMASLGLYTAIITGVVVAFDQLITKSQEAMDEAQKMSAEYGTLADQAESWGKSLQNAYATENWENTIADLKKQFEDTEDSSKDLVYQIEERLGHSLESIKTPEGLERLQQVMNDIKTDSLQQAMQESVNAIGSFKDSVGNLSQLGVKLTGDLQKFSDSGVSVANKHIVGFNRSLDTLLEKVSFGAVNMETFADVLGKDTSELVKEMDESIKGLVLRFSSLAEHNEWDLSQLIEEIGKVGEIVDKNGVKLKEHTYFWNQFVERISTAQFSDTIAALENMESQYRKQQKHLSNLIETRKQEGKSTEEARNELNRVNSEYEQLSSTQEILEKNLQKVIKGEMTMEEVLKALEKAIPAEQFQKLRNILLDVDKEFQTTAKTINNVRAELEPLGDELTNVYDKFSLKEKFEFAEGFSSAKKEAQEFGEYLRTLPKYADASKEEIDSLVQEMFRGLVAEKLDEQTKDALDDSLSQIDTYYSQKIARTKEGSEERLRLERAEQYEILAMQKKFLNQSISKEQRQEILRNIASTKETIKAKREELEAEMVEIVRDGAEERLQVTENEIKRRSAVLEDQVLQGKMLEQEANAVIAQEEEKLAEQTLKERRKVFEEVKKYYTSEEDEFKEAKQNMTAAELEYKDARLASIEAQREKTEALFKQEHERADLQKEIALSEIPDIEKTQRIRFETDELGNKFAYYEEIEQAELDSYYKRIAALKQHRQAKTEIYNRELDHIKSIYGEESIQYQRMLEEKKSYTKNTNDEIIDLTDQATRKRIRLHGSFIEKTRLGLANYTKELKQNTKDWVDMTKDSAGIMKDAFSDAFSDFILGTKSAGDAFNSLKKSILTNITEMMTNYLTQQFMNMLTGGFSKMMGGGIGGGGGMFANLFHAGGTVGVTNTPGRTVGDFMSLASQQTHVPKLHNGTKEYAAILEKGEEVIPKGESNEQQQVKNVFNVSVQAPGGNISKKSMHQLKRELGKSVNNAMNRS